MVTTSLDQNRLLGTEPIPFAATTLAVALGGEKADFIEWDGRRLIRRDGVSGKGDLGHVTARETMGSETRTRSRG